MATTDNKKTTSDELNPVPAGTLDMAQFAELLKINARELAAELKKPDEETQARNEEIKQRKLASKAANIEAWKSEQALIKLRQDSCGHIKENGKHNFVSNGIQPNGYVKAVCQSCHWNSDWFEPWTEMRNGAELREFSNMTRAMIDAKSAELKAKLAREKVAV